VIGSFLWAHHSLSNCVIGLGASPCGGSQLQPATGPPFPKGYYPFFVPAVLSDRNNSESVSVSPIPHLLLCLSAGGGLYNHHPPPPPTSQGCLFAFFLLALRASVLFPPPYLIMSSSYPHCPLSHSGPFLPLPCLLRLLSSLTKVGLRHPHLGPSAW
jgi:hypothetical protein